MAAGVAPSVDAAHAAGLPFRLTELNSLDCGGRPGISNAFATALWAPAALFDLMQEGVDGVNVHLRANTINAPFAFGPRGVYARPLFYGLALFRRALGNQPALVPLTLHARRSLNLQAWAVRSGHNTLHVLVLDDGRHSVKVRLNLPARGPAVVQRLLAPSARALTGVTLGGQWMGRDGQWQGQPDSETVDAEQAAATRSRSRTSARRS